MLSPPTDTTSLIRFVADLAQRESSTMTGLRGGRLAYRALEQLPDAAWRQIVQRVGRRIERTLPPAARAIAPALLRGAEPSYVVLGDVPFYDAADRISSIVSAIWTPDASGRYAAIPNADRHYLASHLGAANPRGIYIPMRQYSSPTTIGSAVAFIPEHAPSGVWMAAPESHWPRFGTIATTAPPESGLVYVRPDPLPAGRHQPRFPFSKELG